MNRVSETASSTPAYVKEELYRKRERKWEEGIIE
jgi:hypothetical protein